MVAVIARGSSQASRTRAWMRLETPSASEETEQICSSICAISLLERGNCSIVIFPS